eukprot:CAMPEP_0194336702 /NCGR_PEP_ID=MMETSP0171-20130528/73880_1 /TAXON_ID=218684 /ORGANISM="Corethron pennatum, Strain L29A3" /LENGTH=80 /DNA_ID=CAMNT_0039100243 /DNA_START=47 /DNA_END=285 /DNA_ORIENTATION=+
MTTDATSVSHSPFMILKIVSADLSERVHGIFDGTGPYCSVGWIRYRSEPTKRRRHGEIDGRTTTARDAGRRPVRNRLRRG